MRRHLPRLVALAVVQTDERTLAGLVSGVLFLLGSVTLGLVAELPGVPHTHEVALLATVLLASLVGLCSLTVIDWSRAPAWVSHLSNCVGLALIAVAIASSGGPDSPAWIYLFFAAAYAAYFYRRSVAMAYMAACVTIHALPLLYDRSALRDDFLAQLIVVALAYLLLVQATIAAKHRMAVLAVRAERLAAEQGALRRVATAVVGGEAPERVFELAAYEAAALLEASAAGIVRLEGPASATLAGVWLDRPTPHIAPGARFPIPPGLEFEQALRTGRPTRIEDHPAGSTARLLGYGCTLVAPIRVTDSVWGVLVVSATPPRRFDAGDEHRLLMFGDLLATAIANIEDRAKLAAQAMSDPLTGLANHRTFKQRLSTEVGRALRHGTPLSVAVIDIDHFKQVNDSGGHEAGDELLVLVADALNRLAREEDTVGRLGGDEFAWILPDTTSEQALIAVQRARRLIAASGARPYRITLSAGISDTYTAQDPGELIRLADQALYWSKAHGRDQCRVYDPAVADELPSEELSNRLQRSQAMFGLRTLARAIDARSPWTREHSERVSDLASKLARGAGWPAERALQLGEAALLHDIGKLASPPADGGEEVQTRAELAARILEGVLSPEQIAWVAGQYERADGSGHPRGLVEDEIPEGAALLALADAWDIMTSGGPEGPPLKAEEAMQECARLAGQRFTRTAVQALLRLYDEDGFVPLGVAVAPLR